MTSQIVLNEPMIDWLSISTYDENAARAWWRLLDEMKTEDRNIMQYQGKQGGSGDGTLFVGSGMQKRGMHHLIRVSGALADECRGLLFAQLKQGNVRVTRIDIQITIREPKEWSQWKLFNRRKRAGKTVSWFESKDRDAGTLSTVYVGSRKSDRFSRIYIKPTKGGGRLLRVEVEYKRDRARLSTKLMMDKDGIHPGDLLLHELENAIGDGPLLAVFSPHLAGREAASVTVTATSDDDKTLRWLMEDVFPVFKRIAYSHDMGDQLIIQYGDEIETWVKSGGWDSE